MIFKHENSKIYDQLFCFKFFKDKEILTLLAFWIIKYPPKIIVKTLASKVVLIRAKIPKDIRKIS